jgi:hypothetical protein
MTGDLNASPAADEVEDDHHEGDDEQQMDEPTADMEGE